MTDKIGTYPMLYMLLAISLHSISLLPGTSSKLFKFTMFADYVVESIKNIFEPEQAVQTEKII